MGFLQVYSNCQCSSAFCLSMTFCPFYVGFCWERAVLLVLSYCCSYFMSSEFMCSFPNGVYDRMSNSIVSVPDRCFFIYFLCLVFRFVKSALPLWSLRSGVGGGGGWREEDVIALCFHYFVKVLACFCVWKNKLILYPWRRSTSSMYALPFPSVSMISKVNLMFTFCV